MQGVKLRPTFSVELPWSLSESVERLRGAMRQVEQGDLTGCRDGASSRTVGRAATAGCCLEFHLPEVEQHFWSPYLSVQLQAPGGCSLTDHLPPAEDQPAQTLLYARFSPSPTVWTFVMFCYATMGGFVVFGLMFAYVQWILAQLPWALALVVIGALAIVSIHLASRWGQQRSEQQMANLKTRLDRVLAQAGYQEPEPSPAATTTLGASAP